MINYNFTSFGTEHGIYLIVTLIFWLSIPILGKRFLNKSQKNIWPFDGEERFVDIWMDKNAGHIPVMFSFITPIGRIKGYLNN